MSVGDEDTGLDEVCDLLSFAVPSFSSSSSSDRRRNVDSLGAIETIRDPGLLYQSSGTQNVNLVVLGRGSSRSDRLLVMSVDKDKSLFKRVGS